MPSDVISSSYQPAWSATAAAAAGAAGVAGLAGWRLGWPLIAQMSLRSCISTISQLQRAQHTSSSLIPSMVSFGGGGLTPGIFLTPHLPSSVSSAAHWRCIMHMDTSSFSHASHMLWPTTHSIHNTNCVVPSCHHIHNTGTWRGHELSVDGSGAVVVATGRRTATIPYSQAKSPAEVCVGTPITDAQLAALTVGVRARMPLQQPLEAATQPQPRAAAAVASRAPGPREQPGAATLLGRNAISTMRCSLLP